MPICNQCNDEFSDKAFPGSVICYRCIYYKKNEHVVHVNPIKRCKICDKETKKGRSKYCSTECYEISKKNAWYRKLNTEKGDWKNNPIDIRNLT